MENNNLHTGLEFKHLRTVVALAEAGSITKAAKILHVTQPALSTQLLHLEQILGFDLVTRTPKGVQLTEKGNRFLVHAKSILKYSQHAIAELKTKSVDVSGLFSIGCANSLANSVGAIIMMSLIDRYPKLKPSIQALGGTALQQSVVAAELDFYITSAAISLRKNTGEILFTADNKSLGASSAEVVAVEHFLVCLPSISKAQDEILIHEEIAIETLQTAPLCLFSEDHTITTILDWLAKEHNLNISRYGYTNNSEIMIDLVLSGEAIVLLPSSFAKLLTRRPNIALHPLKGYTIEREIVLCHADDLEVMETTRLVKDLVADVLRTALQQ